MYVWTLSMYVCMNLVEMCCWFNHHFGLLVHFPSILWCIFAHVLTSKLRVYTCFQGVHSFHLPCVRTLHAPSLACYAGHTLSTNKDILLASVRNCGQVIMYNPLLGLLQQTVWGLVGTSYRGDPLTCCWVQHHQQWLIVNIHEILDNQGWIPYDSQLFPIWLHSYLEAFPKH